MRTILNISLPQKTALQIKSRAKKSGFASVSEYARAIFSLDDNLISEGELLKMSKEADREYKTGKMKKYHSLRQLLK